MCNLMARWLVPVGSARTIVSIRLGLVGGVAALASLFGANLLPNATANGDTRAISFHHIHLKEDTTITYKVNGRFVPAAMEKINHALRDWRTNDPTTMDPELIDALWEVHRATGSQEPIHVIGGYRSPTTNAMLRRRSSGVAKFSQHMRGKAIDFFIPDVELDAVREAGLRVRKGGVGFYPSSGAPFVHMDTGSVRHWPRLPEAQLAKIMSKGPLTQFAANSPAKAKKSRPVVVASNTDHDEDEGATAARATGPRTKLVATVVRPDSPAPTRPAVAKAKPRPVEPSPAAAEPAEPAAGGFSLASASSKTVPAPIRPAQAASLVPSSGASANDIVNQRGYWQGIVEDRPTPPADIPTPRTEPAVTASITPGSTAWPLPNGQSKNEALAYAPPTHGSERPTAKARVIARLPGATAPQLDTTIAVKNAAPRQAVAPAPTTAKASPSVRIGDRVNNPWMRAMMMAPNALQFMNTSLSGSPDMSYLRTHIAKPTSSVMMTFSDDPHLGMTFEQFRGNAVVFVSTVTFSRRTAALQ